MGGALVYRRVCRQCGAAITNRLRTEPERLYTDKRGRGVYLCGAPACLDAYQTEGAPEEDSE
jgi:hypothetical protein